MSEWKLFESAPKNGTNILATDGLEIYSVVWDKHPDPLYRNNCAFLWLGCYGKWETLTHWMEAPTLPVKRHHCHTGSSGFIQCYEEGTNLCLDIQGKRISNNVDYCLVCGEKAST